MYILHNVKKRYLQATFSVIDLVDFIRVNTDSGLLNVLNFGEVLVLLDVAEDAAASNTGRALRGYFKANVLHETKIVFLQSAQITTCVRSVY